MVEVGLTGSYEGQFILEISKDVVLKIASNNKGYPIVGIDKSIEEIFIEIANLIIANAVAKLLNKGISLIIYSWEKIFYIKVIKKYYLYPLKIKKIW